MPYNLRPRKQKLPEPPSPPKSAVKSPPKKPKKASRSPPGSGVRKNATTKRQNAKTKSPKKTSVDRAELLASLIGADKPRPDTPQDRPPRKRWIHHGEPIHDRALAPKGWTSTEPDLAIDDYEGQIARCHERIADGILPRIFERKLKEHEGLKANRDKLKVGEPEGLSWEVYERLNDLKSVEKQILAENDDPRNDLPNVRALIAAYRSGRLKWKRGRVTYWFNGKQLCEPRRYSDVECEALRAKTGNEEGFWIEGLGYPGPAKFYRLTEWQCMHENPSPAYQHYMEFAVRVPGATDSEYVELVFLDDTGSDSMFLFQEDLALITKQASNPGRSYIRRARAHTAGGYEGGEYHKLEVAILQDGQPVTDWVTIRSFVKPGSSESNCIPRLSGMWMRRMIYTATAPDNTGRLFLSTTKAGLERMLPDVDAAYALPRAFSETGSNPSSSGSARIDGPFEGSSSPPEEAVPTPAWEGDLRASGWDTVKRPMESPAILYGDESPVWVPESTDDDDSMNWAPSPH